MDRNTSRGDCLMKKSLKKTIVGIMASTILITCAPQTFQTGSILTANAAQIHLSTKKISLPKGKTKKLKLKNASGKIKWSSSKKSIATVSAKGMVKAKKAGKTVITATYRNKKYKCSVTVPGSSSEKNTDGSSQGGSSYTSTVYWTPGGSVYHVSRSCPTLSRSKTVYRGSRSDSGKSRACRVCS